MEEKKNKFLFYIKQGFSRSKAVRMSEITVKEWEQIYDRKFALQIEEIESQNNLKLEEQKNKDAILVYNPILDNYSALDFNNREQIERAIEKTVHYQTLAHPENVFFAKNSIMLMKLTQTDRLAKEKMDFEKQQLSNDKNIIKFKQYAEFVKDANYPDPYPKQFEMRDFANQDGIKLLLAARKYGKTDYLTILNTAYKIYSIPNYTCMIITKEEDRAKSICRSVRQACEDNGVEFEVKSAKELRVKGHFGKEASLIVLPLGASGFRGHHVDEIIADDPIVPSDKTSPANRQKAIDVYNELINLSPNILVIGQPVHMEDLYAVLKESALNSDQVKLMEVPHGSIPELDVNLSTLRNSGVSEESIGANYLLQLRSEGILPFYNCPIKPNDDIFNPLNSQTNKYLSYIWIDPAKKETGRDYTAVAVIKILPEFINVVGFAWRQPYNNLLAEIKFIDEIYEVTKNKGKIFFEMNGLSDDSLIRLREWGVRAVGFNTKENKEKKISAMTYIAENIVLNKYTEVEGVTTIQHNGKDYDIHLISPNNDFNKLFTKYEYGTPDDAVDSVSSMLLEKGVLQVTIGKKYKV